MASSSTSSKLYDLVIVLDATGSMGSYLSALQKSIPEIIALTKLTGAFSRLGICTYTDYDIKEVVHWSGWDNEDLAGFANRIRLEGGGDYPEAAKTALVHILKQVDRERETIVFWYADAPPHHISNGRPTARHPKLEQLALEGEDIDWVHLSFAAKEANCKVFSFVSLSDDDVSFYTLLSETTNGSCIHPGDANDSGLISRLSVSVIMQWLGQTSNESNGNVYTGSKLMRFESGPTLNEKPTNELEGSLGYLPPPTAGGTHLKPISSLNFDVSEHVTVGPLAEQAGTLHKKFGDPSNGQYRRDVYSALATIIDSNVAALSYNAIFGQLWRAVCKENDNPDTHILLNSFSKSVANIKEASKTQDMKAWLEDSYDATEEILAIISKATPGGPSVYLDLDSDVHLTRIELLEVSRSCHSSVLKKLVSMFTHLKLVEPDMVLHPNQRTIPLNLPPRSLFRILPHLVVPGTLWPSRASAISAILALSTSIPFLKEPAITLLSPLKGTWLNVEVPENISYECARFLLSAPDPDVFLNGDEKTTYASMRRYKLLELNLKSTLHVAVPWTPSKVREVGDAQVRCLKCSLLRSVTMMSEDQKGVCGPCIEGLQIPSFDVLDKYAEKNEMESCWVECSVKDCRAQYVVQNPHLLNVRPKCYYCRQRRPCPWVECTRCENRVVFPAAFRRDVKLAAYLCPPCTSGKRPTVTDAETTLGAVVEENGCEWLGVSKEHEPFQSKSAFKMFSKHGTPAFGSASFKPAGQLKLNSKKVFDVEKVYTQINGWVDTGSVELGMCSLCFSDMSKSKLVRTCGRSGCQHMADEDCLRTWYGKNAPGNLINLMELSCPFCRRLPSAKIMARYNDQVAALGGVKEALENRGWFYAWCVTCGFAKPAVERACCAGDEQIVLNAYECQDCTRAARARATERDARLARVDAGERGTTGNPPEFKHAVACPSCTVMVEKSSGCNHITCVCGAHFCYVCGKEETAVNIYQHMTQEHGGIYDEDDYDDEDEDDYD